MAQWEGQEGSEAPSRGLNLSTGYILFKTFHTRNYTKNLPTLEFFS